MKYHRNEKAVLLIPKRHNDFGRLKTDIEKSSIFDKVIGYDEIFIRSKNQTISEDKIADAIEKMDQFVKNNFPVQIKDFDEIYVADDHYSFGVYLVKNQIPYNFFEDARGRLSTEKQLLEHILRINPLQKLIAEKLNLLGNHPIVEKRFGDLSVQQKGYKNKKDINFSVTEIINNLPQKDKHLLIKTFSNSNCTNISGDVALLLTQHYINIGILDYQEQKLLYTYLVDYFCNDMNLLIKIHPSDVHGLYEKWFPDSMVLDRLLPSEFLPYCVNTNFKIGVSASSTAIYGLSDHLEKTICFTQEIEKTFPSMNRYYVALKIVEKALEENIKDIYTLWINEKQLINLADIYQVPIDKIKTVERIEDLKKLQKGLLLIDSTTDGTNRISQKEAIQIMMNVDKNINILYLNSKEKNSFYIPQRPDIIKQFIPIVIEKKLLDENRDTDLNLLEDETLYFREANDNLLKYIKQMKVSKKLTNTNIEITIDQRKEFRRKVLEAELKSAKARIIELSERYLKIEKDMKKLKREKERIVNSKSWIITKPIRHAYKLTKRLKKKLPFLKNS
jgi:hypothetical protein